jgi:hypothetical protein
MSNRISPRAPLVLLTLALLPGAARGALAAPRTPSRCFDPQSQLKPIQQAWRCWVNESTSDEPDTAPSSSQTSSPAGSSVSPDITAKGSFADLVGLALDSAFGVGNPDQAVTLQLSPFGVAAAFDRSVLDNPDRYVGLQGLRRIGLSVTLGGEPDEDSAFATGQAGTSATRNVTDIVVLQGSYRAIGSRDRRDHAREYLDRVGDGTQAELTAALVTIAQDPALSGLGNMTPEQQCEAFLAYFRSHADAAQRLTKAVEGFESALADVNGRVDKKFLLTFKASTELRKEFVGRDKYRFGFVAEGFLGKVDLTANGEYRIDEDTGAGRDEEFRFAVSVAGKILRKSTVAANGIDVSLSSSGRFRNKGRDDIFLVNAKIEYPLRGGLTLPFSITYANHSELVKEKVVRGNFGISYDLSALKGKGKKAS